MMGEWNIYLTGIDLPLKYELKWETEKLYSGGGWQLAKVNITSNGASWRHATCRKLSFQDIPAKVSNQNFILRRRKTNQGYGHSIKTLAFNSKTLRCGRGKERMRTILDWVKYDGRMEYLYNLNRLKVPSDSELGSLAIKDHIGTIGKNLNKISVFGGSI